jgi:hypothetical protein
MSDKDWEQTAELIVLGVIAPIVVITWAYLIVGCLADLFGGL